MSIGSNEVIEKEVGVSESCVHILLPGRCVTPESASAGVDHALRKQGLETNERVRWELTDQVLTLGRDSNYSEFSAAMALDGSGKAVRVCWFVKPS